MKEILERFIEWVNKHGGPTPVALAIGKSPQSFYNYTNRGSKPNMEIFALLANHYEDFDASYILTGKVRISEEGKELERIKNELQRERAIGNALLGKSEGVNTSPDVRNPDLRKRQFDDMKKSLRGKRSVSKPASVHVQGEKIPTLTDLFN